MVKGGDSMNLPELVKAAGVVGAGGAGFPTHVKLDAKADCLIINAAECEPLIETDKYLTRTFAARLIAAVLAVGEHLGVSRRVIALKSKYHAEISALKAAIAETGAPVELFEMPAFYPAGDEQILVNMICGVTVPERGIPLHVGAVVDNVGTLLNVMDALEGKPVTEKYLSVVGEVAEPVMLKVPVGTPLQLCIDRAKPTCGSYGIILGGPMMGKVVTDPAQIASLTVSKTLGNILVLRSDHFLLSAAQMPMSRVRVRARSACIQCRMCTDLCPRYQTGHRMRPHLVMRNLYQEDQVKDNAVYERMFGDAANCSDCGACEIFSCPMQLSPRRVNGYIKGRLREKGIQVARDTSPKTRESADLRRIPTDRLVARLGLSAYYGKHPHGCEELMPPQVYIPFQQHIGKAAEPVKAAGEVVCSGELLAAAAKDALSANIHASIDGVIERIDEKGAVIIRVRKE